MSQRPARTMVKIVILLAAAIATLTVLVWVNQQNVRDVGPGRAPLGQAGV
jgi:hypothetical protein